MAVPPSIPARPSRSQAPQNLDAPKIPPRPSRSIERSVSPNRDTFARSPLNDPSFINGSNKANKRLSASDLPARPPSVTLPSIGQEGSEYEGLSPPADESSPRETRDAGGLKLYAPRAEVPQSTAKSRIQGVTRTDSTQAAAAGFGRAPSESEKETPTRSGSAATSRSRPQSLYNDSTEQGIPEIGMQVPMYPNAGDVQAPTPSPYGNAPSTGIGFFNNVGQSGERHHSRTKSGREIFHGPPGSYGRHGHGIAPRDAFEKDWYAKHPEDAAKEAKGEYGPAISDNRKEWALSSDDLNKLVQDSANHGIGMGTSSAVTGTPAEEIGYLASEEYASRMATPLGRKDSTKSRPVSQTFAESPLRKTSFPADALEKPSASALEDDDENDVIHIDPPANERSHIHGGGPDAEDLGPEGGNTEQRGGFQTEEGDGAPILAADELERHKTPGAEHMQPAVPPELEHERRASHEVELNGHRRSSSRGGSRPPSRPTSGIGMQGIGRWKSHGEEGLDDVKEYEPLFPEDDEKKHAEKPLTVADKLKRPDLARHHFPSQDVWEDTPSSLQLQTEVETPEQPDEPDSASATTSLQGSVVFEKPEAEEARKSVTPNDQESFLSDHTKRFAKSHIKPDVAADVASRPGIRHRFPSQDVWEDTPDHLQLVTEVEGPQEPEEQIFSPDEEKAPADEAPQIPARPHIPTRPARAKPDEAKVTSPTTERKAPTIPERPKPQMPIRPTKRESSEEAPLSKVSSVGSNGNEGAAAAAKPKPPVPTRPGGSKIAALKAGFLSDLNSRLQLGPQAPKPKTSEKEDQPAVEEPKAPLADARKGRARGPQRRKPAATAAAPAETVEVAEKSAAPKLEIANAWTVWQISDDGNVGVPSAGAETSPAAVSSEAEASIATQVPSDPKPVPEDDAELEKELSPSPDVTIKHEPEAEGEAVEKSEAPLKDEAEDVKPAEEPSTAEEEDIKKPSEIAAAEESTTVETAPSDKEALLSTANKQAPLPSEQPGTADEAVQTGQQDLEIQKPHGEGTEKLTAYLGGRAPEEGSVVVKDGVETVGDADERGGIERTGGGM